MKDLGTALASGLWAPVRRLRLALVLWLVRLLPILLFFSLPVFDAAHEEIGNNPQGRALLNAPEDASGFSWAWTEDFFRTGFDAPDRIFWLCLGTWLLVAVLSGGLIAAFVRQPEEPLLVACGRYAGRFVRLAFIAAVLVYLVDAGVNGVLAAAHTSASRAEFTQEFFTARAVWRGILFPALVVLIGIVHTCAQVDMVAHERRSAFLSFGRGIGVFLVRLPKLLVVEAVMLLAAGAAALLAWLLMRITHPAEDAGWLSFAMFLVGAALGSYLRTGIELGALEARCRILAPPAPPLSPLETVLGPDREAA